MSWSLGINSSDRAGRIKTLSTIEDLLVSLKSLQHITTQAVEGFIGGSEQSVMSGFTQHVQ